MTIEPLYKVTALDGSACHGGTGRWTKNRWRTVHGPIVACERGLHLATRDQLVRWLGPAIWLAETDGEVIAAKDKIVARKARVVHRFDTWNERTQRLFAADCAEHVLPLFEAKRPNDDRPRRAIDVARRFARGEATDAERRTAAAYADAAYAAADAAYAAYAAAYAYAAADAAYAYAAAAYAYAAAYDAADAAERKWQIDRLFDYLEGRAA